MGRISRARDVLIAFPSRAGAAAASIAAVALFSFAAIGQGSAPPNEPAKKLIAVLEFHTKLAAAEKADADPGYFSDVVRAQTLDALPGARLMTHENMIVLLQAAGKDLAQCEGECDVETGRKLGADYVVSGELLKVGTSFKLDLKIHATSSGELIEGAQASGKSVDALDEAVPDAVKKLVGPLLGELGPKSAPPPLTNIKPAPPPIPAGQTSPPAPVAPNAQVVRQSNQQSHPRVRSLASAQADLMNRPSAQGAPAQQPLAPNAGYQHIRVYPDHIAHLENFFDLDQVTLRPESGPMMHELANALRQPGTRPGTAVCQAEHKTPGAFRFARQRALAIRHGLIELHVPADKIGWSALHHGDTIPGHKMIKVCSVILK